MTTHALDNPVWHSLVTQHARLAITSGRAARYPAAVVPFAAVGDPPERAGTELTSLIDDGESLFVLAVAPPAPAGWALTPQKPVSQMVCREPPAEVPGPATMTMTGAQSEDMLALTALVFPGFFRRRTLDMGSYVGIYDGARLAAMAGERMRLDGYQEISAVCTHPDYTGRGYAQRLMSILCQSAFERGFTPFLHVYPDNARAIGVYHRLGFAERVELPFWSCHQVVSD